MTGLLVSVRDVEEATDVLRAGVDIVDVKEPTDGSLGAASPQVWQQVVDQLAGSVPVSLALGELRDEALGQRLAGIPAGTAYVKIGLAGCQHEAGWRNRWREEIGRAHV